MILFVLFYVIFICKLTDKMLNNFVHRHIPLKLGQTHLLFRSFIFLSFSTIYWISLAELHKFVNNV